TGPLVIGFDPAWTGGDRHSMAFRRGRRVLEVRSRTGLSVTESAGWLGHVIRTERPVRAFVDVGGGGAGRYDTLALPQIESIRNSAARPCGLTSMRPTGSFSTLIFSPGPTPFVGIENCQVKAARSYFQEHSGLKEILAMAHIRRTPANRARVCSADRYQS